MARRKQPNHASIPVSVALTPDKDQQETPPVAVYGFSSGGQLLNSVRVKKPQETIELKVPLGNEPDRVRVMVGPAIEDDSAGVSELLRRDAAERFVRVEPGLELEPVEFHIPPQGWLCWLLSRCFVPGRLLKRQDVDGTLVDFPVCHTTVEVYEVDPFPVIIDRLPLDILERLRDIILHPQWPPEPQPIPEPGPGPIPRPAPRPPEPSPRLLQSTDTAPRTLVEPLRLAHGNELRATLVEHPHIVRPIICRYYPWLVRMDKVAETVTDDCGRFEAAFFRGCHNQDQPDLYFKAKRTLFFGIEVTLYAPTPVACHTWWNYSCGSDVTLYTDHPLAQTCQPCEPVNAEGHWVLVTAIGNLPLSRIRGASDDLAATTTPANIGLNHALGHTDSFEGRPFGKLLRLRMAFDNSLRSHLNVHYYRVYWRKQGEPDSTLLPLDQEVHRHYTYEQAGEPVVEGYALGPKTVNGTAALYEIPPALPPKGQWTIADAVEDTTSAKFPTAALAPAAEHGKYELVVELYDASGNRVDINNVGGEQIRYYVPENRDLSTPGTINTVSAHGGSVDRVHPVSGQDAFILPLHVDNNACTAEVQNAVVGGSGANACGVFTYGARSDTATFPFKALHPNGFASYTLTLKRGVTPVMSDSGRAQPPGQYDLSATVDNLLPADCDIGGFSAHLHVEAWATNGWGDINSYDAGDHAGFALAPDDDS